MEVTNSLTAPQEKKKFSEMVQTPKYQELIYNTLGNPEKAKRFIAAVTSAVAVNPELQECDAGTILSGALLGESLNLVPSPQLGQYYLVPYKLNQFNKKTKQWETIGKKAQFQLGYKGFLQLAVRSGYYKKIVVEPIKQGELIGFDPIEEEISLMLIEDEEMREEADTIGYYAMFEHLNGFRKVMYWSRRKMEEHAGKYSKAFNLQAYRNLKAGKIPKDKLKEYSSFWYKDFDAMGCKTMLRQLLSKWGVMSSQLQEAIEKDMGILHADGTIEYIDNPQLSPDKCDTESTSSDNPENNEVSPENDPLAD